MKKLLACTMLAAAMGAGLILGLSAADAGVIEETIENKTKLELLGPDKPVVEDAVPILDAGLVEAVIVDLRDPELHNGYLGIARKNGLTFGQVKEIKRVVDARLLELAEAEAEPIP